MEQSIHSFQVPASNGSTINLADLRGKTLLLVNTASKCGFAPQFKGLEVLHQEYRDKGLVVLGFPCDQFANQEPGNDEEIASTCALNFGVTFPLTKKIDVNGDTAHPLWKYLKSRAPGVIGSNIKWNFTKFLVSPDGSTIRRYAPQTEPEAIRKDIEALLKP